MNVRLIGALAGAAFSLSPAAASAQTTMEPAIGPTSAPRPVQAWSAAPVKIRRPVTLALETRNLRGTRRAPGYRLTGQGMVNDACTTARFTHFLGTFFPPRFDVVQYRRPGTRGPLCAQRLTWVTIEPLDVVSGAPPRYVGVSPHKGMVLVPILPGPVH